MGMKIIINQTEIPDISSTAFRNDKLPELLPQKIYNYIKERGIYGV
jgi:nicotinic acid mononucleotide adenylyltransferase